MSCISHPQLCPKEQHAYGVGLPEDVTSELQEDEQQSSERQQSAAQAEGVQDSYAWIGRLSPALLAVLGVAADYYPLHCFTR